MHSRSFSQLEPEKGREEAALGSPAVLGQVAPWWNTVENLSSKKQEHKALNMESQRGLRKGQYSSPPLVCVRVLCLPVSVSFTLIEFQPLREINRDVHFYIKKLYASSLCRYITHTLLIIIKGIEIWEIKQSDVMANF